MAQQQLRSDQNGDKQHRPPSKLIKSKNYTLDSSQRTYCSEITPSQQVPLECSSWKTPPSNNVTVLSEKSGADVQTHVALNEYNGNQAICQKC